VRIVIGPTVLDRAVGLDMLVAIAICALATEAAWHRHTRTLPMLLVLTMLVPDGQRSPVHVGQ
jgi:multicomponent Na+:H+ antiporter subunit F